MNLLTKPLTALCLMGTLGLTLAFIKFDTSGKLKSGKAPLAASAAAPAAKIQVALLLDVSNSMDGLINQAKSQLWNMVNVLGRAQCNGVSPTIEIALYEYGRTTNDRERGFVRQINSFTTDLNLLSENLFKLTTNGGEEFCGQVIHSSLQDLRWDSTAGNYRVIFIAGNENFTQGPVSYKKACEEARKKGVIVNTIYCGTHENGIRERWNLGGECSAGSFSFIDHNESMEEIATPFDTTLITLNQQLNQTYIAYGFEGRDKYLKQEEVDAMNYTTSKSAAIKRVEVKSKKSVYKNSSWDLLDGYSDDSTLVYKVDRKTLPDSLKNKKPQELKQIVARKSKEREVIQKKIQSVAAQRQVYIAGNRNSNAKTKATLQSELERIIRQQAGQFNMIIE
jgi:hypothetical protein